MTREKLNSLAQEINAAKNAPMERENEYMDNVGHYFVKYSFGFASLFKTIDENGGIEEILRYDTFPRMAKNMQIMLDCLGKK